VKGVFIVLLLFMTGTVSGQKGLIDTTGDSFAKVIDRMEHHIDLSIKSLGKWKDLVNIPDMLLLSINQDSTFLFVFNHPKVYSSKLLKYIENPSKKWEYRYFALGLMQGMCFKEYIQFFPKVYNVIKKEMIKRGAESKDVELWKNNPYADILYLLVFQNNLSQEMRKNYADTLLRKYLSEIKKNAFTPSEIKDYCDSILSGQDHKNLHLMTPPLFRCKEGLNVH